MSKAKSLGIWAGERKREKAFVLFLHVEISPMSLPLAPAYPCLTRASEENLPCQLLEVSLGDINCAWT